MLQTTSLPKPWITPLSQLKKAYAIHFSVGVQAIGHEPHVGKDFPLDTQQVVRDRLAASLGTTKLYL
ncbi:hypothetical protein C5Y93_28550 [Blastopirellula marina]|uniref:Uncharacterized protein n=1 Tax=Blastopirellula marina TaxID=124 RepID=A0A2S8GDX7_9BACT|nr:hypothetical protein C5Y93_28550 [Blastopirellula marina]